MPQDLNEIYKEVHALFDPYRTLYRIEKDGETGISLTSMGPVELAFEGKVRAFSTMFFASAIQRKAAVVFYFMPVYTCPELKASLGPDLLKTLKGHTCFHLKKLTPALMTQVQDALALGHRTYVEKGWVEGIA